LRRIISKKLINKNYKTKNKKGGFIMPEKKEIQIVKTDKDEQVLQKPIETIETDNRKI
jgi:hypothetical protein